MLYSVLYIMLNYKTSNFITKTIPVNIIANIPAIITNVFYVISIDVRGSTIKDSYYLYYYIRVTSIFVNFVLLAYIYYRLRLITNTKGVQTVPDKAIRSLVNRLKYYPIVQVISRLGYAWYEQSYGFNYAVSEKSSITFFVAQMLV